MAASANREEIIDFRKIGGGYLSVSKDNVTKVSIMYITEELIPARDDGKGKTIPAQPERGYIRRFDSKYLDTYERNEFGAIKTRWTYKVINGYEMGTTVPMKPVIAERRGVVHYDHNKKYFVFSDITEALEQYLAEREAREEAERVLQSLPKTASEATISMTDDEAVSPLEDDYESEEDYENAEDSPEYQDDELLNDLQPVENGSLEVDSMGVVRQVTEANSNVEILQPVETGKFANIRNAFPNIMVVRPA